MAECPECYGQGCDRGSWLVALANPRESTVQPCVLCKGKGKLPDAERELWRQGGPDAVFQERMRQEYEGGF